MLLKNIHKERVVVYTKNGGAILEVGATIEESKVLNAKRLLTIGHLAKVCENCGKAPCDCKQEKPIEKKVEEPKEEVKEEPIVEEKVEEPAKPKAKAPKCTPKVKDIEK